MESSSHFNGNKSHIRRVEDFTDEPKQTMSAPKVEFHTKNPAFCDLYKVKIQVHLMQSEKYEEEASRAIGNMAVFLSARMCKSESLVIFLAARMF
jgi:hypothetical protein